MQSEGKIVSRRSFTITVSNPEVAIARHSASVASLVATLEKAYRTVLMVDAQKQNRHSVLHNRAIAAYNKAENDLAKLQMRKPELISAAEWYKRVAEYPIDTSRR